ncbi:MAG: type II toxin-antitoxin system prevent-host-death family antitoxin [Clostridia bacterium]|nr:type II toxin-antitoxin system prevent-host-death family antitoxin [Clostridia bacterium]
MDIKTNNLVSISEANQNFSKVVKNVDESNSVIILKNNKPKYILSAYTEKQFSENDMLELIARRILSEHKHAFEVLGQ